MIRQWFNYFWVILFNLIYKNEAIEASGNAGKLQHVVVLSCFFWDHFKRRTNNKKQEAESRKGKPEDEEEEEEEAITNIDHLNNYITKEDKMEIVPVEEKMNQVAEQAPSEIGHVVESEIDTNEETTTTEVTHDSDELKHKEQTEEYEAKGTAEIVGTKGKSSSTAEAKSKQSESVTEATEGDRKVLTTKTSSAKSYSFEETLEYEED